MQIITFLKYRDLKTLIFLNSTWNLTWVSTEWFVRFDANLSCKYMIKPVRRTPNMSWERTVGAVDGVWFPSRSFFLSGALQKIAMAWRLVPCEYTFMMSLRYCNTVRLSSGSMLIKFMAGNHSPREPSDDLIFRNTSSVQNDNFVQPIFLFKNVWQKKMVQTPVVWRCFP